ncbi:cytochrome c oxidase subunit II [Geomonas sp. RF6]|uniref:cytochrome c oxidase subunit II n=1 Tax=Geomonas sp. RF6 TaxID=2897342 RepID=UPI001E493D5E|nr:cytochrome c oxidase subunit II [Geomonas sp. RF6]UFS72163.1 cytochrome c oxidase subunit II [Geomonas sp. RF6]
MQKELLTTVQAVDPVFIAIFGVCLVMLVGVTAATVIFVFRYRRSRAPEPTSQVEGSLWLETLWTLLPTLIVLAMFYYGWAGYLTLRTVPANAFPITATARMWSWSFKYPNGKSSAKLVVPVGKPVKVALVSKDVLHGFYLPAFRVKRDVVPGMQNYVWFVAAKEGSYDVFCSQYCGTSHSGMVTAVQALPAQKFEAWLQEKEAGGGAAGRAVLEKYGCLGCHSLDGSRKIGPSLKGIWGRSVTVHSGNTERALIVDEAYLRHSITEPAADVVDGYKPVMPSFAGQLTEEEMRGVLAFLRTQGKEAPGGDGAKIAKERGCLGCHSVDGSRLVGPSFKGLYGRETRVSRNGKTVVVKADETYIRESILTPHAAVVEGYQPVMPDFDDLREAELGALVRYIEGIK